MNEEIENLRKRVLQLVNEEKWDELIQDAMELIRLEEEPDRQAAAYFTHGVAYFRKGDYDRVIADCTKAIELNPEFAEAYRARSFAYLFKAEFDQVIDDCIKAIELNPEYAEAYFTRGLAYVRKDNYSLAYKDFKTALEKNPILKIQDPHVYIISWLSTIDGLAEDDQIKAFKIYADIMRVIHQIRKLLFYKESKAAHYTSLHVLKSLSAKEGCFRLYNAGYMNDPEEGQVFFKMMKEDQEIDIEKLFYKDEARSYRSPAYIGSFIDIDKSDKQKDKLFLWRTYGKHDTEEATGACLIFDNEECFAKSLPLKVGNMDKYASSGLDKMQNDAQESMEFYKIYYRGKDQELNLKDELKGLVDTLRNVTSFIGDKRNNNVKDKLQELVRELLDSIRFLFKEKHYSEENEVRVIRLHYDGEGESPESEIKIDVDNIPPRFYLEAPENFRFSEVILGPRTRNVQEWKQWLKKQDDSIDIKQSEIRYGKP